MSYFLVLFTGMSTSTKSLPNIDYTYFLGPDYKKEDMPKRVSTIVGNHISWMDIIIVLIHYRPIAFAAK